MAVAARDDNTAAALIGVSSVDGTTPVRARTDPVTGYVLATIINVAYSTTLKSPVIDDNAVHVNQGVTNDASNTVRPLLSDPNNPGYVLADATLI